jgi:formylmethanofuran dehydrogenase subunit A
MGFTTVVEPAIPPLTALHAHEEFEDIPMIEKLGLLLLDSNYQLLSLFAEKEYKLAKQFTNFLISKTKTYGIKLVNPCGKLEWEWGNLLGSLDECPHAIALTPRQAIQSFIKLNTMLGYPSPVHLHCNSMGVPGNAEITAETIKIAKSFGNTNQLLHLVHLQFHAYGGSNWKNIESKADALAKLINSSPVTIDTGQIMFGHTVTMTADGPFEYELHRITKDKWVNIDIENETGCGLVPYLYKKNKEVNAIQFAIGLELALLVKSWQVVITTDHPNGSYFINYPEIYGLLMDKKERLRILGKIHPAGEKRTTISSIDREITLEDLAIMTRALPSKILGLRNKGSLGIGCDADVAIYDLDINNTNYSSVTKAFKKAKYTIKKGEMLVKDGNIVKTKFYPTIALHAESNYFRFKRFFERFYSLSLENFGVGN